MKKTYFILLILCGLISAQSKKEIPRDTSFSLGSTMAKVYRQFPSAKLVDSKLPEGVDEQRNITYTAYGDRELHLDIFTPKQKSKLYPGVILIHGGGWRSGFRQMETPMAQFLATNGYVTATVEYRLSIEALYPAAVNDLKIAVRWMRANAAKYNIDTNKIAVYGCSSGGQLAALIGTTNGIMHFEHYSIYFKHSSDVQAIIDVDGVVDMTDPNESGKDTIPGKPSAGKQWFGASLKERRDLWTEASPINYVSEKTPPILFVNSSIPRYHAGRDEMISILNKYGVYSEVHTMQNSPHPFWLFHPWFDETSHYILKFLDRVFKGK
jgi:acetyl esterase/lipase